MKKGKRRLRQAVRLVGCAGVGLVGLALDVPAMCAIALAKAPALLLQGWRQQVSMMWECIDGGSCSWQACLPLTAGLLLVWPVRVAASVPSALVLGLWKAGYSGWIVYSQGSVRRGLRHAVAAVAEFDESTNDEAHLWCHGSCLPRPSYRDMVDEEDLEVPVEFHRMLPPELSRLLTFMASREGRSAMEHNTGDVKRDSASILYLFLNESAKLCAAATAEQSVYDPLETLERQIREAELESYEWEFLRTLVVLSPAQQQQGDLLMDIRRGLLEAFGRRIRGIAGFVSRDPAFKKCYRDAVQDLGRQ